LKKQYHYNVVQGLFSNFPPPDDQDKEEDRLKRLAGVNLQSEHVHQIDAKKKRKSRDDKVRREV
jgi:hypothetical protein